MALKLESSAFQAGEKILAKYTCEGSDLSPPLSWGAGPAGTKSWVLIMDDPDAPMGTWVHWVAYNIPPSATGLAEGTPAQEKLADGTRQGINDFRKVGYGGPCPPPGKPHRYFFKLYALDALLELPSKATKAGLLEAMKNHILAEAQLMGQYQRGR